MKRLILLTAIALCAYTVTAQDDAPEPVELLVPQVIAQYPHDSGSYTQGLLLFDGLFYESAGQYGESDVREVEPESGEVLRSLDLSEDFFAEGLARVDDRLIQITWQENTAFVYDLATFEVVDEFTYEGQGWGLCFDEAANVLYMTDGSSTLFARDPETFDVVSQVQVTILGEPLENLNELECVDGAVWANVWTTDYIVRIDPASGSINGVVDATGLLPLDQRTGGEDVLNGIAYNAETGHFYLTGKLWPALFEVEFVPYEQP